MMKRYYSHYTFIYPDIFLKNHLVEINSDSQIMRIFPFDKETERTEFYSGLLLFLPGSAHLQIDIESTIKEILLLQKTDIHISEERYKIVHKEDFSLSS
jgi:hypothetical protein